MAEPNRTHRRSFITGAATSLASAAASRDAHAAVSREQLKLDVPFAPMAVYARMHGSRPGKPSIWYGNAVYYGQLADRAPVPILGAEELNLVTVDYNGSDRLTEVTNKVTYYQDLESGKILTKWRNIFTKEMLDLTRPQITTTTVIENSTMKAEERSSYVKIDRRGNLHAPFLQGDVLTIAHEQFATFTASALDDQADHRVDQRWWSGIWSSFSANAADFVKSQDGFLACHGQTFGGAPWYSWLKMGDRPGTSSMRRFATKLASESDVPPRLLAWIAKNHSGFLTGI